jgi:hypothetical protein
VLNRAAPYAADSPYDGLRIDESPTRANAAVADYIVAERPDVVVFDSAGRVAQYRAARASGARVVYVSSRAKTRWKGFRWRRMRLLDQHWIAQPGFLGGRPTAWERFKLGMAGRPEICTLDVLHEPVDGAAVRRLQLQLGLEVGQYVAVCPGGGGDFGHATDATQVFFEVAQRLARSGPLPVVAVLGERGAARAAALAPVAGLHVLATLPNGQLVGLLRDAAVVAVNGGSLLLQSMAQGVPIVAAPIAGDQVGRIHRCAREGYVRKCSLEPEALAAACSGLLHDEPGRERLRARLAGLRLGNGVDVAADAIARLLMRPGEPTRGRAAS